MELETYVARLRDLGVDHYVLLERRNTLRKVLSSAIGKAGGRMHQSPLERPVLRPITLPVNEISIDKRTAPLMEFLRDYDRNRKDLENALSGESLLRLTYEEDILPDARVGYARFVRHLGLMPRRTTVRFGRTNPFPVREMLENFDEVHAALAGTEFEWMLED